MSIFGKRIGLLSASIQGLPSVRGLLVFKEDCIHLGVLICDTYSIGCSFPHFGGFIYLACATALNPERILQDLSKSKIPLIMMIVTTVLFFVLPLVLVATLYCRQVTWQQSNQFNWPSRIGSLVFSLPAAMYVLPTSRPHFG